MAAPNYRWRYMTTSAPPTDTPIAAVDLIAIGFAEGTPSIQANDVYSVSGVDDVVTPLAYATTSSVSLIVAETLLAISESVTQDVSLTRSETVASIVESVLATVEVSASESIASILEAVQFEIGIAVAEAIGSISESTSTQVELSAAEILASITESITQDVSLGASETIVSIVETALAAVDITAFDSVSGLIEAVQAEVQLAVAEELLNIGESSQQDVTLTAVETLVSLVESVQNDVFLSASENILSILESASINQSDVYIYASEAILQIVESVTQDVSLYGSETLASITEAVQQAVTLLSSDNLNPSLLEAYSLVSEFSSSESLDVSVVDGAQTVDVRVAVTEALGIISESTKQDVTLVAADVFPGATDSAKLQVEFLSSDGIQIGLGYANLLSALVTRSEEVSVSLGEFIPGVNVALVSSDSLSASSVTEYRQIVSELIRSETLTISIGELSKVETGFLVSYYDFVAAEWKPCVIRIYDFEQGLWISPKVKVYRDGGWTDGTD